MRIFFYFLFLHHQNQIPLNQNFLVRYIYYCILFIDDEQGGMKFQMCVTCNFTFFMLSLHHKKLQTKQKYHVYQLQGLQCSTSCSIMFLQTKKKFFCWHLWTMNTRHSWRSFDAELLRMESSPMYFVLAWYPEIELTFVEKTNKEILVIKSKLRLF